MKYNNLVYKGIYSLIIFIMISCNDKNNFEKIRINYPKDNEYCDYTCMIKDDDTIMNGQFKCYNSDGKLIREGNYLNGDVYGPLTLYSDDGKIDCVDFKGKDKKSLQTTFYYTKKNKIEKYVAYDDYGDSMFMIWFDENGNVKKYTGLPLIETFQWKKKSIDTLNIGDTLRYKYIVSKIPNAKRNFSIHTNYADTSRVNRKFKHEEPTIINVKEIVRDKGKHTVTASVEYRFNDLRKTTIKKSTSFDFYVR